MGRNSSGDPSEKTQSKSISEGDVGKIIDLHRLQSKKRAIELLSKSLASQLIDDKESKDLIAETCMHFGIPIPLNDSSHSAEKESSQTNQPPKKKNPVGRPPKTSKVSDEHNEVCDVCEKGGDLLCCETCTLVFHLRCLRPKLSSIPKKKWSCPHCILDNLAPGDKDIAKIGIQQMTKLTHGIDPDDPDTDPTFRLGKAGETTIVYSGKKYIVRKRAKRQIEELGRFSTLQEALITIPVIEEAKNGKKRLAKEDYDEDLWCTHCMDDPSIEICGFCGCKKCFGRFDTHLMVLCDNCERETHTFCMNPPSMEVPEEDPWYCEACIESGEVVYPIVEPEQQQEEIKDNTNKKRRSKTPKTQEGETGKDTIKPEGGDNNGKRSSKKRGPKKDVAKLVNDIATESLPETNTRDLNEKSIPGDGLECDPVASLPTVETKATPIFIPSSSPVDQDHMNNIPQSFIMQVDGEEVTNEVTPAKQEEFGSILGGSVMNWEMGEDSLLSMLQPSQDGLGNVETPQKQQLMEVSADVDLSHQNLVEMVRNDSVTMCIEPPLESAHTPTIDHNLEEMTMQSVVDLSPQVMEAFQQDMVVEETTSVNQEDVSTGEPVDVEMETTNDYPAMEVDSVQIVDEPNLPLDTTAVADLNPTKAVEIVITDSLPGPDQEIEAMSQSPPLSPSQAQLQHTTIASYAEDVTQLPEVEASNVPLYVNEGAVYHQDNILGSSYHEVMLTVQSQPVILSSIPTNNIPTTPIMQHPVSPNPSLGINYFHTFQGEEEKLDIGRPYATMFSPQHSVEYDLPLPPPMSSPSSSFMTSPRGRGRPPGTFKRKDLMGGANAAVPQNTYSIRPHREKSYQSLMSPLKKFKSESSSHVNNLPTTSKKQGATNTQKKKKTSASKRVEEAFDPKVYAVDNICKMVQEANERKITPVDLDALELLRIWAPKQDLERVVNELTIVRDKLLRRLNRMAPDVAHDFLRKTNITDHIDFDFVDDNDHEFEMGDPDRDLSEPNDMDFEHDPMDDFMAYGMNPDEHHHQQQHHMQMEDGSESPDLLLQFSTSMLEDSDEHEKSRDSAYGHHDLMSMHTVAVDSMQHPHDMSQTLPQTMMDMNHNQLYNINYHHG